MDGQSENLTANPEVDTQFPKLNAQFENLTRNFANVTSNPGIECPISQNETDKAEIACSILKLHGQNQKLTLKV
jgi:hypothetical protein